MLNDKLQMKCKQLTLFMKFKNMQKVITIQYTYMQSTFS